MGIFYKNHSKHGLARPHSKAARGGKSRSRICRFEQMEQRQLLSAAPLPIHVGAVYFEDSNDKDLSGTLQGGTIEVADIFEVTFNGGAAGTELNQLRIDTRDATFFDTAPGGAGVFGSFPLKILSQDGFEIIGSPEVADGGTTLVFNFRGFNAGEKLVFTIDVDETGPTAVAEGGEFDGAEYAGGTIVIRGATLTASFTAPHTEDLASPEIKFADYYVLTDTGLDLPNDQYDPPSVWMPVGSPPGPVYTAGAIAELQQIPLSTLSGHVFEDFNANNYWETGEPGIAGVTLRLWQKSGESYVPTTKTTTTDGAGAYAFIDLSAGIYRVVEDQPAGYISVGATPGTVDGVTRGIVTSLDELSDINLAGGEDSIDNDFAETRPVALSGHVYHDRNNNGVMELGEEGIGSVMLIVENLFDHSQIITYTIADGSWSVDGLMPGAYRVVEEQPATYLDGLDAPGSAGGFADNPPPGDSIDGIYLVSGQIGTDYDFGELKTSCISGYVYVDANNNGIFDEGETPIEGVTLALLDANGNPTGQTRTTDAEGFYRFCGLAPALYGIVETQPGGYYDGLDTPGTTGGTAHNPGDRIDAIPLQSGTPSQFNNFGELLPASIRGQVHADLLRNCIVDSGEPLLANVTIWLLDGSGNRIQSTTTDVNGKYAFTNLKPGVYGVEEIQPAGYLQGDHHVGSAGGILSNPDRILQAQLGSGVDGVHYDFCEIVPAKISGYVFQDGPTIQIKQGDPTPYIPALRDGKLTPDDKRLSGVTLQLCDASGVPLLDSHGNPITTVTNAEGYYEFTMLSEGMYSIVQIQPPGYLPGIDTAGSNGGLVVNRFASIEPSVLSMLAVDPSGSAIVQIWLSQGESAVNYNFSEVLVESKPDIPPFIPPTPPTVPTPPPQPIPFVEYRPVGAPYMAAPQIVMRPMSGGSGGPGGYTWHLSIIDAGHPRREGSGDQFTQFPQNQLFDPVSWTGSSVDQGQFVLADKDGNPIKTVRFGVTGGIPVVGNWDGSGTSKVGVFREGIWFLDVNGNGLWDENDLWAKLGKGGDQPVSGDWNGDGKTDIGIFGPAWIGDLKAISVEPGLPDAMNHRQMARPKNVPPDPADAAVGWRTMKKGNGGTLRSDLIDHVFEYGTKEDRAVSGDWNGDGIHSIGIFRNGVWFLDMDGDGRWSDGDVSLEFGREGDLPVVGDWTGDGISKVGVYRDGTFYLDTNNNRQIDAADKVFALGEAGNKPVAGDWNGDGIDEVGVYQDGVTTETQTAQAPEAGNATAVK